jgi:hypothetical protein
MTLSASLARYRGAETRLAIVTNEGGCAKERDQEKRTDWHDNLGKPRTEDSGLQKFSFTCKCGSKF